MGDLTAHHYLKIYRLKLGMAENGTTHPSPEAIDFMKGLVAQLAAMDPSAPIRLEATSTAARFTDARSGKLLAVLQLTEDA